MNHAADDVADWTIEGPDGARLRVASAGAATLSWEVPAAEGTVELLDGYRTRAEVEAYDGFRGVILAPWSNRVRDSRWDDDGTIRDLGPGPLGAHDGLHGLVFDEPFTRIDDGAEDTVTLTAAIPPGKNAGYPYPVRVEVIYALEATEKGASVLRVTIQATNTGSEPAPIGLGWHPYFRLPGHETIEDLHLDLPAATRVLVDDALIPLAGEAAVESLADEGLRLTPIGDTSLDQAFTDLRAGEDGQVVTTLSSPRTGDRLVLRQEAAEAEIVHLFTSDTLDRGRRGALAMEPCTFAADALNRRREDMVVPPGRSRRLEALVSYEPGTAATA